MTAYQPLRNPAHQPFALPDIPDGWLELVARRRITRFADFPAETQARYAHIASLYPGTRLHACGSRVRGDYVTETSTMLVRKGRQAAGMKNKRVSDYDFTALTSIRPVEGLPAWADLVRQRTPANERIPLPMWNFKKIPAGRRAEIRALILAGRWRELLRVHNELRLSPYQYADCCDLSDMKRWWFHALDTGLLNDEPKSP